MKLCLGFPPSSVSLNFFFIFCLSLFSFSFLFKRFKMSKEQELCCGQAPISLKKFNMDKYMYKFHFSFL